MKTLDLFAQTLLLIGGVNYAFLGLYGLDGIGLLADGCDAPLARSLYTLVGLAAAYQLACCASMAIANRLFPQFKTRLRCK